MIEPLSQYLSINRDRFPHEKKTVEIQEVVGVAIKAIFSSVIFFVA